MHLISWNVAGWATTVECIKQRHGSVESWIERHNVDILCLQEVKLTSSKLSEQPTVAGISPSLGEKYDVFFACCSAGSSRGFNGVATFCRKGLTVSSDPQPLGEDALDSEGRALVTIHDGFAVLNVYVPNDGAGSRRLPFKMRFLRAVEECMDRLRRCGLKVFLVGDLNIGRRAEDISWDHRVLNLSSFVSMELPDASCSRDMRFLRSLFTAPCCSHCGWRGCQCRDCFPRTAPGSNSRTPTPSTTTSNGRGNAGERTGGRGAGPDVNGGRKKRSGSVDGGGERASSPQSAQQSEALRQQGQEHQEQGPQQRQQQQQMANPSPRSPSSSSSSSSSPSSASTTAPSTSLHPARGTCRFCRVHLDDDEKQRSQKRTKHLRACLRQATALQALLRQHWPLVTRALESRVVEEQEVKLKRTSTQTKYRVSVRGALGRVRLGQPCETKHRAERMYTFERRVIKDEDGSGDAYVVRNAGEVCVAEVVECLEKIAGVSLADYQQRCLAMFAGPISSPPCVQWLNDLLDRRGYVDAFTTCYPTAQARFTCHDQYKNRRYENAGSRIDYIVLDADWQRHIQSDPSDLISSPDCSNPFCAMCALSAATLNGRWKPAPFDGTGMVAGKKEDYDAHFTRPRTGVVYTPPQYSDHLAISIVMDVQPATSLTLAGDKTTRSAQPHRAIKRISSFFTKRRRGKTQQSTRVDKQEEKDEGGGGRGRGAEEGDERGNSASTAVGEARRGSEAGCADYGGAIRADTAGIEAAAESGEAAVGVALDAPTKEEAEQHKGESSDTGAADSGLNMSCDTSTQESHSPLSSSSSSSAAAALALYKRRPTSSSSLSAAKKPKGSSAAAGVPSRGGRTSSSSSSSSSSGSGGRGTAGKTAAALKKQKKKKSDKNGKGKKAPPPGQRKISAFFQ